MTNQDLNQSIGQLFMCGFDGLEPTKGILDLIRDHHLGSIILFSRNIESPEQVQRLTRILQQAAKEAGHTHPLLIAVDQENGVVRRLGSSGTYVPGNMALGALNSTSNAYQVATATAKELLALGINWNLAPIVDVNNNPLNPVIGVRSFGEDPELVTRLGMAQVEGYQKHGVVTSVKHFPGHGDTSVDSHLGLPVIDKSFKDLQKTELVPFVHAIKAQDATCPTSVMVAHIALPQLTKQKDLPASISSDIVTDLLRDRLGYKGVIITDCCEMNAIKDTVGSARGAVMALQAGNDISMISHTLAFQQEAFHLLRRELQDGNISQDAVMASLDRIITLKNKYLSWDDALKEHDLSIIGCQEHRELSYRLYDKIPTIVRDNTHVLPIRPTEDQKILFLAAHVPLTLAIDSEKEPFDSMYRSLQRRHNNTEYIIYHADTSQDLTGKMTTADYVIVGTANANLHLFQSKLVQSALEHAEKLIVVAVINPYDLMVFPQVDTFIVTYEYTPPAHEAFVRLVFGEIETHSKLPVTIPNTNSTSKHEFDIQPFHFSTQELSLAYELWNTIYANTWPLAFERFCMILSQLQQPYHVAMYDKDQLVAFAATQTLEAENAGQLALLMVHPDYRQKGLGTRLNDHCLERFRQHGSSVMLGSGYPRFFCGVPNDDVGQQAHNFFKHRGYALGNTVWDLMGDVAHYDMPEAIQSRMKGIWFGSIKKEQLHELLEFQSSYFPYWLSTYKHHADLGDYQDLIVAREYDEHGKIVGSLVLFTTGTSSKFRTDLVWTDDSLFGMKSGGMACVGVASEERGRGIGLGLVAYANTVLRNRGVHKSYVDWVELVDFYGRIGYQKWRSYTLGAMK
ncbi:hypothetical protein CU098_012139 [Rhizopus stolonifer]|uniref:N-acetyltransferase domain-containing protein n=1 Tax=Rhizopus stolonifer TaxID=4846 RepID=A0A367KRY7_RHIST|nr:hypothetical protein CU098_012139 [Rhizopus stolonifer]